jgi:DNA repair exonuclease SbcCD ATPase subunit
MIAERAAQLREVYQRVADRAQVADRLRRIEETRGRIQSLADPVIVVTDTFTTIHERLTDDDRRSLTTNIANLAHLLRTSQSEFSQGSRQVVKLERAHNSVKAIQRELERSWQRYVDDQTRSYRELLVIIRQVPAIESHVADLQTALEQLQSQYRTPPRTAERLARFDAGLDDIRKRAREFEELPHSVRDFLSRVAAGQATLMDVSPEILQWLDTHDARSVFAVRLSGVTTR